MNSFSRFGITHLSPSSLNLWRAAPGLWNMRYIAKIPDEGNPKMWRGTAVETGLAALLYRQPFDQAVKMAYVNYELNSKPWTGSPEILTTQRDLIAPMIKELEKWKPPSALNATQVKVEYFFDPVPIPVRGYLDFGFEEIDIDLKSTEKCPKPETGPSSDHVRQVSLYRAARNRRGALLYTSHARHQYFEITDDMMNDALEEMREDALSLNNFLARCETREDALRSLPIDWSHWKAPKTKIPLSEILLGG